MFVCGDRRAVYSMTSYADREPPIGLELVTPDRSGRSTRRSRSQRVPTRIVLHRNIIVKSNTVVAAPWHQVPWIGAASVRTMALSSSGGITPSSGRATTLVDGWERGPHATPDDRASFMRLAPRALPCAKGASRGQVVGSAPSAGITSRCTRRHRRRLAPSPLRGGIVNARAAGERPR